jgi:hypothetical protein
MAVTPATCTRYGCNPPNITLCIAKLIEGYKVNPLTPELNLSAQRYLARFFTGDFAFCILHFVNICLKTQQLHQLFIQFINYVW